MSFQHLNTPPPGPESCRLCVLLRRGSWLVSFRGREDPDAGKCVRLVLWYTGLGCRATWVVRLDISWRRQAHCRVLEEPRGRGWVQEGWKVSGIYRCCSGAHLHPTLWDPMDCSPPGSSVHGILQARILEWVAISSSRGSSWPRDWTYVSCIESRFLTTEPPVRSYILLYPLPISSTQVLHSTSWIYIQDPV